MLFAATSRLVLVFSLIHSDKRVVFLGGWSDHSMELTIHFPSRVEHDKMSSFSHDTAFAFEGCLLGVHLQLSLFHILYWANPKQSKLRWIILEIYSLDWVNLRFEDTVASSIFLSILYAILQICAYCFFNETRCRKRKFWAVLICLTNFVFRNVEICRSDYLLIRNNATFWRWGWGGGGGGGRIWDASGYCHFRVWTKFQTLRRREEEKDVAPED
jgi:hypothetical protein